MTGQLADQGNLMRLLVVEDYLPIRLSVVKGLKEAGFAVDETGDGAEGLWYAESFPYDVIILDIMLPKLDGMAIVRKLRKAGKRSRILMLTAKGEVSDRVHGLESGADDYLVKPFAFTELLARVRSLVRRQYDLNTSEIKIGDLEIDLFRQQVVRSGRVIDLTAREFSLLQYLAARAGQVVSRLDIWEHIYDFQTDATSNVVDVYIGYLRKKLEEGGSSRIIHTRRGKGYVVCATDSEIATDDELSQ